MTSVEQSALESIKSDDFLKNFITPSENFSIEQCSQLLSVNEQIAKLSAGIEALDVELQKQVSENHEDLLFHATWIEKLENVLEMMTIHMQSLMSGVERISSKIIKPYEKMEEQNMIMENILKALNVLRRIAKIQVVSHRLPPNIPSDVDILKLSANIQELDKLWNEIDLSNIKILESSQKKLRLLREDVSKRAKAQMLAGIKKQNSQQISRAVQIFHDLNTLEAVVKEFLNSSIIEMKKVIDENLGSLTDASKSDSISGSDVSKWGPGKAARPVENTLAFSSKLWSTLDEIFDSLYLLSIQIEFLEASLHQSRSDFISINSCTYFEEFASNSRSITQEFWDSVNSYLGKQLIKYSKSYKAIREALEGEYPRFLRLFMDLCKKLQTYEKPENFHFSFTVNKDVLAPFEQSYLSNLDSVVSHPVHSMFSIETVPKIAPSTEDIDSLIRIIQSELSVALFDHNLSSTIARNITKSIGTFCSLCEEHIVVQGSDAVQVIGPRKAAQDRNIDIANRLEYLKMKLKNVTANLGKNTDAAEILNLSLVTYADSLITKIIKAMLESIVEAIKKIIQTMHIEDFSKEEEKETSISLYMRELTTFVARAYTTYLKPFESQDVLKKCCTELGMVCLEYYLRHVSIIRPLGAGGLIRLTADCNEFETAMTPLLGEEPKAYRMLRLFKLLLTQPLQEILTNTSIGTTIPYSLVLFYLFSRAPDEMKSPHESGVDPKIKSIDTLSDYLDTHTSERDRIDLINRTLAKYCDSVRQTPGKSFNTVYGIMAQLIQRYRTS